MARDTREVINFRIGLQQKKALMELAREQDKSVSELVREVVEAYVAAQERAAWEAEARRQTEAYAAEARVPGTPAAKAEEEWEEFWLPLATEALDNESEEKKGAA